MADGEGEISMHPTTKAILEELERFGCENDAGATDKQRMMLNITPETGEFLALLVRAVGARRVLEIGTSNGYSTIWLADAVREPEGIVVTVDISPAKAEMALGNIDRAGLSSRVRLHVGEAGEFLKQQAAASFNLVFLDADRTRYVDWWPAVRLLLAPGGLLVIDNAVSHAEEMAPFAALLRDCPDFMTSLVPIGKGELLALKHGPDTGEPAS